MVMCLIPSALMLVIPTNETTENRPLAAAPSLLTADGSLNRNFFADFEDYFTDHLALRNQLVYADARIQTLLFQESNVSGVISGTDGWLFYASTLEDYLGTNILSDRDLFNLAHNILVVQNYLQARDIDFVFTIPPNKNTLHGEYMPYYKSYIVDPDHSAKLLGPILAEQGIQYLDLFTLLEQQAEPMYLLLDSHWNGKGACLVYNAIMDTLDLPHEDYASTEPGLVKNENGDLNRMLYSFYGPLEENDSYNLTQEYTLTSSTGSVEDGWIVTENPGGSDTLLMFRDSFANTLIPFLSNEFETAYYAKGEPNALWRYVETYGPDCVVIEKVERNISNYLENPPILPMPEGTLPQNITIAETATTARIAECLYDPSFYMLSGTVDEARMQTDSEILVCVNGRVCQAYQTGGNSYALYLKKEDLPDAEVQVQVYIVNGNLGIQALWDVLELPR